jgi:hypothetical protein
LPLVTLLQVLKEITTISDFTKPKASRFKAAFLQAESKRRSDSLFNYRIYPNSESGPAVAGP